MAEPAELVEPLTDEQRETISECEACMAAVCAVCGHEPCMVCVDDCDQGDCIIWNETTGTGRKTHRCVFARCEQHR